MGGASVNSIIGSEGTENAKIVVTGNIATVTRGNHNRNPVTQNLSITITISRIGEANATRVVTVTVPRLANNGTAANHPDITIN